MPIVVYNAWIPRMLNKIFKTNKMFEISAITLYPFILIAEDKLSTKKLNHETIHIKQQAETLIIGFYLIYLWDYIVLRYRYKLSPTEEHEKAYYNIRFEQEAYDKEKDLSYLKTRKRFSWIKYKIGGSK